jgi:hypothetical protein
MENALPENDSRPRPPIPPRSTWPEVDAGTLYTVTRRPAQGDNSAAIRPQRSLVLGQYDRLRLAAIKLLGQLRNATLVGRCADFDEWKTRNIRWGLARCQSGGTAEFFGHGGRNDHRPEDLFQHGQLVEKHPIDRDVAGFSGGWFAIWHLPDSVYAGVFAAQYGDDERALLWAQHLNGRVIGGRHPESGLDKRYVGRADLRDYAGPLRQTRDDDLCYANFAQEIYVNWRLAELAIAETLGNRGQEFRDWAVSGLKSYSRHGYDSENNTFRFLKTDGTSARERTTVPFTTSGPEGERESYRADFPFLLSYARAWRMSKDPLLWQAARGNGLGDIGSVPGQGATVNVQTDCHDPFALLAVLEIYRGSGNRQHLDLAHRIAENVVARLYINGLILDLVGQRHTRFSALAPLALLHLEAASRGAFDAVPPLHRRAPPRAVGRARRRAVGLARRPSRPSAQRQEDQRYPVVLQSRFPIASEAAWGPTRGPNLSLNLSLNLLPSLVAR